MSIRLGTTVLLFVLAAGAGYYWFVWKAKRPELLEARAKETELWTTLETKAKKAANLQAYKDQLAEMEKSFGAMLRQLPNKTEVPNLLVDISQSGLAAGLEEKLFQPEGENRKDFYAELPIRIRLTGGYHEMGAFASGIAALPRIVTLHDIEITPASRERGTAGRSARGPRAQRDGEDLPVPGRGRAGCCAARGRRGQGARRRAERQRQRLRRHMTTLKRIALVTAVLATVAGCSSDLDDLQARITEVKSRPGGRIEPLPEVKPYETFSYAATSLRSPFVQGMPASAMAPGAVRPDFNRPREFLEQFSLDTLRMVGTLRLHGPHLRPDPDAGRTRAPGPARQPGRPERRPDYGHRGRKDLAHRDRHRRHGRLHRAARRNCVERMICKEIRA